MPRCISLPAYIACFIAMIAISCIAVAVVARSVSSQPPVIFTASQVVHSVNINGSDVLIVLTNVGNTPVYLDTYIVTGTSVVTNATCVARSELRGRVQFTQLGFTVYPSETVIIYCNVTGASRVVIVPR